MSTRWLAILVAALVVVGCGSSGVVVDEGEASIETVDKLTISTPDDNVTVRERVVTVTGTATDGADVVLDVTLGRDDHATAVNGRWSMDIELDEGENLLTFRVGDDATTAATLFLVYEPPTAAAESPEATPEPESTPEAEATPETEATEELEPTEEAEPKPLSVKVVKRTRSVPRNATASVTIKTTKGARCYISVVYLSGESEAKGLGSKKADSKGQVTWKWKVGGRTTKGTWPIYVTCELGDRSGEVDTEFRVR